MLLLPPVALKLGSTGWRFARYYLHAPSYVRKGPPNPIMRLLAPGVVLTTLALFAGGVALAIAGSGLRVVTLGGSLVLGLGLAVATVSLIGPWLSASVGG